mmetsp:Transcript_19479/g.44192  ORF Transcript_19479/g.44192 Transcript_19479/m.44192 type:complete len:488 (+) Transcript_19479:272-1735(+)|eukprot:CAMPEP_0172618472 /NCGR_PEP_ID=MMETSP1068-20121228/81463_1 /TAXON_ID=35684 /ORGANISM="Pseudopedinella elastica, Strain CCMP716" /LENGTH=487 /DNA_ID=CAMNT_0013424731 /DNA_START=78 /DNA_END=1541 /DNA_ORIENTATION=-
MNTISLRRSNRASSKPTKPISDAMGLEHDGVATKWTRGPDGNFPRTGRRGAPQVFPRKLFEILDTESDSAVGWNAEGTAFEILDMAEFTSRTLLQHFRHQKYSSFQRQLNLYGFRKVAKGPDCGAYAHESFLRDRPEVLENVRRLPQGLANPHLRVAPKAGNKLVFKTSRSPGSSPASSLPSSQASSRASSPVGDGSEVCAEATGICDALEEECLSDEERVTGLDSLLDLAQPLEARPSFRDEPSEDSNSSGGPVDLPTSEWDVIEFDVEASETNQAPPVTQQPFGSDEADDLLSRGVGRMVLDRASGNPIPLAAPSAIAVAEPRDAFEKKAGPPHLSFLVPKLGSGRSWSLSPATLGALEPLDVEKPDTLSTETDRLPSAVVFAEYFLGPDDLVKSGLDPSPMSPSGGSFGDFGLMPALEARLPSMGGCDLDPAPAFWGGRLTSEAWFGGASVRESDLQLPQGETIDDLWGRSISASPPQRVEMQR